jgi:uncharacterized membrane protein YphA (DoxX/SURF4 family)
VQLNSNHITKKWETCWNHCPGKTIFNFTSIMPKLGQSLLEMYRCLFCISLMYEGFLHIITHVCILAFSHSLSFLTWYQIPARISLTLCKSVHFSTVIVEFVAGVCFSLSMPELPSSAFLSSIFSSAAPLAKTWALDSPLLWQV